MAQIISKTKEEKKNKEKKENTPIKVNQPNTISFTPNQEFFGAGQISWNLGTLTIILSTTHDRKASQGKIPKVFLLDALKIVL